MNICFSGLYCVSYVGGRKKKTGRDLLEFMLLMAVFADHPAVLEGSMPKRPCPQAIMVGGIFGGNYTVLPCFDIHTVY